MIEESQDWVLLSALFQHLDKARADKLEAWLLDELACGRMHYSYVESIVINDIPFEGRCGRDDLPEMFWLCARIDRLWSAATSNSRTICKIKVLCGPKAQTDALPSEPWVRREFQKMKEAHDVPQGITDTSKLIHCRMEKAVKAGECVKVIKPRPIEAYIRAEFRSYWASRAA